MSQDLFVERLFDLLVQGDHHGARRLVEIAQQHGLSHEALARDAYLPLIGMINALHRAEQLTNLAHDYATQILGTLVDDAHCEAPQAAPPRSMSAAPAQPPTLPHRGFRHVRCADWVGRNPASADDRPQRCGAFTGCGSPRSQYVGLSVVEGILTARLTGPRLGDREVPIINTEINDVLHALGPHLRRLVLDLSDVHVISSMALGMCLDLRRRARLLGARTATRGLRRDMSRTFRRLGIPDDARRGRFAGLLGRAAAA